MDVARRPARSRGAGSLRIVAILLEVDGVPYGGGNSSKRASRWGSASRCLRNTNHAEAHLLHRRRAGGTGRAPSRCGGKDGQRDRIPRGLDERELDERSERAAGRAGGGEPRQGLREERAWPAVLRLRAPRPRE